MKITIKKNFYTNEDLVEIRDDNLQLVATITPRQDMISIVSKFYESVDADIAYPAKVLIKLKMEGRNKEIKESLITRIKKRLKASWRKKKRKQQLPQKG